METILKSIIENFNLKHFEYYIEIPDEPDIFFKFALIALHLIKTLNESRFEINPNNCYISVNDERLLNSLLQLIVCFGLHYNLEDQVGVSIDRLSKYGVNITKKRSHIDSSLRNQRLITVLTILYQIKTTKREHINLIHEKFYRRYMHEIICSLIQVVHSPRSSLINQTELFDQLKYWLEVQLFDEADGSNLVSSLLMAQSGRGFKETDWFTLTIGRFLTKGLLRETSVMNVMRAVLNEINAVSDVTLASDWKKCDLVAKIIAQCPKEITIEEYIKFLAPQLRSLFFNTDIRFARHFYRVAGSIYSLFARRWPQLVNKYFTSEIIHPFDKIKANLSLNSVTLRSKLKHIHLVYVASTEPSWETIKQIPDHLIRFIFRVFKEIRNKINAKKTKDLCEEILRVYFRMMPADLIFNSLDLMLKSDLSPNDQLTLNLDLFEDDSDDLVEVVKFSEFNIKTITVQMVDFNCAALLAIIQSFSNDKFQIDYLIFVFDEIKDLILEKKNDQLLTDNEKFLLNIERNVENLEKKMNNKIILFTLLSHLFESIDHRLVIDNHLKIIQISIVIIEAVLLRMKNNVDIDNDDEVLQNEREVLHLVLSIISVFTTGIIEVGHELKKELQVLNPLMLGIKDMNIGDLSEMADALYKTIITYGVIKSEIHPDAKQFKKPLIEEIGDEVLNKESEYDKALRDSCDPLIPVRAHGLVHLRKLIDQRDIITMENKDKIFDVFLRNLKFEDSYVYLAAINGLISLAAFSPDQVLNLLIDNYNSKRLDLENRLKIGEVLTKTVRDFNDLVPKYGARLLGVFLVGCKNDEELFRSSSLSNLGETCKLLNYSIKNDIYEIINCLSSLLDTDKSLAVRRSSIMVLKMIIEGLTKDNFVQILGDAIKPLYRVVSKQRSLTDDDVVKLNCQLIYDYLNEFIKENFMPKKKLEKEIKVLRP